MALESVKRGLRPVVERARKGTKRSYARAMVARYTRRNERSSASILGDAPVVVSMTSYGTRVDRVALTIEAIGAGRVRPQRVMLWLGDAERPLPESLVRLQGRGLEVLYEPDIGPHGKYYHYTAKHAPHALPLVTADDDVLYPRHWLGGLLEAHRAAPEHVHCYRANVVKVGPDGLLPYNDWPRCHDTEPRLEHFATGVAGVIYPPAMLDHLAAHGEAFKKTCPRADDIWLHWVALQHRVRIQQLSARPRAFAAAPDTQKVTLTSYNVNQGGNDVQIRAVYTPADVEVLRAAGSSPGS